MQQTDGAAAGAMVAAPTAARNRYLSRRHHRCRHPPHHHRPRRRHSCHHRPRNSHLPYRRYCLSPPPPATATRSSATHAPAARRLPLWLRLPPWLRLPLLAKGVKRASPQLTLCERWRHVRRRIAHTPSLMVWRDACLPSAPRWRGGGSPGSGELGNGYQAASIFPGSQPRQTGARLWFDPPRFRAPPSVRPQHSPHVGSRRGLGSPALFS